MKTFNKSEFRTIGDEKPLHALLEIAVIPDSASEGHAGGTYLSAVGCNLCLAQAIATAMRSDQDFANVMAKAMSLLADSENSAHNFRLSNN